ncbi:MAG: HAMP domain-containing protein [Bdellovibrionales bacterium]|nr:HAMP domain-containing protein [Bdellovibrionales bacterium]
MKSLKNISLRYKLLFLLVALTTLSLIVYARLALSIFSEDKIAYVFDSSLAHINAVAKQLRSEVEFGSSKIQFYMNGYDPKESYFHPYTQSVLPKDSYIEGLWTYQYDSESTSYIKKEGLISTGANAKIEAELFDYSPQLIKSALENEIALFANSEGQGKWYLALKYQLPSPERPVVVIGLLSRGYFLDFFSTPQLQDTFLISQQSQVLIRPSQLTYDSLSEPEWKEALDFLTKNDNSRFSVHTWSSSANPKDSSPWLLASAPLGLGNLSIISFVPKDAALATVKLLAVKSSLFLILLIGCISIISVLTAHQLTSALKRLFEATRKVAKGDFEVEIPVESEDEVGGLTRGFNQMTQEIKRLLEETAQKSRMEAELQTAKNVQSTLFPRLSFSSGPIHIEG